ncbi:MAG: hypothetical protein ACOC3V_01850 [bacterium]
MSNIVRHITIILSGIFTTITFLFLNLKFIEGFSIKDLNSLCFSGKVIADIFGGSREINIACNNVSVFYNLGFTILIFSLLILVYSIIMLTFETKGRNRNEDNKDEEKLKKTEFKGIKWYFYVTIIYGIYLFISSFYSISTEKITVLFRNNNYLLMIFLLIFIVEIVNIILNIYL